jgi:succinyl-diaminopimelate desuccinylase
VVSESNPYTKAIKESILSAAGTEPNIGYFSSVGDFNYLGSRAKLPTYVFGPKGDNYHSADEYVDLDTVVKTAEVIYDFLKRVLT